MMEDIDAVFWSGFVLGFLVALCVVVFVRLRGEA
jgi:hypothetical protein